MDDAFRRQHHEQVDEAISREGWMTQYVLARAGRPSFAYSIGFVETFGVPEVLIYGLAPAQAYPIFHTLAQRLASGDLLEEDEPLADVLPVPYTCMLVELDSTIAATHMLGALRRCQERSLDFAAWHLLWPDADNKLPVQMACMPQIVAIQTVK
jgi:hypothetical protein